VIDIYEQEPTIEDGAGAGDVALLGLGAVVVATLAGVAYAFKDELGLAKPCSCEAKQDARSARGGATYRPTDKRVTAEELRLAQLPWAEMQAEKRKIPQTLAGFPGLSVMNAPPIPTLAEFEAEPEAIKRQLRMLRSLQLPAYISTPRGSVTVEEAEKLVRSKRQNQPTMISAGVAPMRTDAAERVRVEDVARNAQPEALAAYWAARRNK